MLKQKIAPPIETLTQLKNLLPKAVMLNLYYSFIHFHQVYNITVWAVPFPSYRKNFKLAK